MRFGTSAPPSKYHQRCADDPASPLRCFFSQYARYSSSSRLARERRLVGGSLTLFLVALSMALSMTVLLGERRAQAVGTQASEFFRAGEASYARGDFPAAARSFEEAHRRAPHAATLYNAALAWEWAQQIARAADGYESALRMEGLGARQKRDALGRLQALEKRLGHIRVLAPVGGGKVTVAHLELGDIPLVVHVLPGTHEVRLTRDSGRVEKTTVNVAQGQSLIVQFAPAPAPPTAAAPNPAPTPIPATSRALNAEPEASVRSPGNLRLWGWAVLGGAVVGLGGTAVYLGTEALQARDRYNDSGRTDLSAYDRASTLRTWTNVLWVGTALVAATGGVLVLTASRSGGDGARIDNAAIALTPTGASLIASF